MPQEKVEQHDWLDYQPTSETGFIEAMCNADFFVISGAGNQLLAENLASGYSSVNYPNSEPI